MGEPVVSEESTYEDTLTTDRLNIEDFGTAIDLISTSTADNIDTLAPLCVCCDSAFHNPRNGLFDYCGVERRRRFEALQTVLDIRGCGPGPKCIQLKVKNVGIDGNYFFRAAAIFIFGCENKYHRVCDELVSFYREMSTDARRSWMIPLPYGRTWKRHIQVTDTDEAWAMVPDFLALSRAFAVPVEIYSPDKKDF